MEFKARVPTLDLSEGTEMYFEFIAEALNHLVSAENSIFKLDAIPNDQDSIDNIYKVFHLIKGLSGFLKLDDICTLAGESEELLNIVRQDVLLYDESVSRAVARSVDNLRTLLALLNEQVHNNGKLKGHYHDVGSVLSLIGGLKKNIAGKESIIKQSEENSVNTAEMIDKYQRLRDKAKSSTGDITVKSDMVREIICDIETLQLELERERGKLVQRQRDLVQERELALKLSDQARGEARAKGDLLSSMAHDIRTLINAILGFSELLGRTSLDKKQKEQLRTIISSGHLLADIVNNILDYSKIEKGKLKLESIDFDLRRLVNDVLRIISTRLSDKPINLKFSIAKNVPRNLVGDPTRLKQILINLLDNALKFTKEGDVSVLVKLESKSEGKYDDKKVFVRFVVEDTGMGIPEEKRELIFESFTQADSTISRNFGGTGLGLSICKSYVEAMGGTIWVESKVNEGSQFIFTVRFKESKRKQEGEQETLLSDDTKTFDKDTLSKISCKGISVLVAEDSLPNQELLKEYFNIIGCKGDFAESGKEAVEKLKSKKYDMCLMDLQMPDMGGLEATEEIKKDKKINSIPIIALTAAAADEEQEKCLKSGMVDYLAKPFDINGLKSMIIRHTKLSEKLKS